MALADTLRAAPARRASGAWLPALVALLAFLALPWGRPGRPLASYDPAFLPWRLDGPWLWLVPALALAALAAALLPRGGGRRGDLLAALGGLGLLAGAGWLVATGVPFGPGAAVALPALVVVAAHGLSEGGRIRGDPFVAASVLFVGLFVTLFILYPLATVFVNAVWIDGRFTLSKAAETLTSPRFFFLDNPFTPRREGALAGVFAGVGLALGLGWGLWRRRSAWRAALAGLVLGGVAGVVLVGRGALPTSTLLALVVASLVTALGLGFALLGQRTRLTVVRRSLTSISLLPIITPPFILAFAMIFLFGRQGLVTHGLFGLNSNALFGVIGVAGAQVLAFTPVAYLIVRGSVEGLDPALEEAAQTLGADRWTLFRTVTWPLLRPALANAFLLTMIESYADFGNPLILGGDRFYLATEVFSSFSARFDPHEAAVLGVVLLAIVLTIFLAQRRWLGGGSFVTVTGKPSSGTLAPLPTGLELLLTALFALWAATVLALYGSILYGSFVRLWGIDGTLTLKHYADFMRAGWPVFLDTARIAAWSAPPAALLGFLIAYLVVRQRFWGRALIEYGSMLSFAIPGTVMGVAYILAFNTGPWLLTGTTAILVFAFVFRNMPVAIRGGVAGLAQIDPSLEEASTTLRAPTGTTLRRILLPLLIVPLLGGLIFAFVRAMTAVSQVIFLVSPGNMLATVLLLGWVEQGQLGRAAAMGSVLIVSMLVAILLLMLLTRGRGARVGGLP